MTKNELATFLFARQGDEEWFNSESASLPVSAGELLPLIAEVFRDARNLASQFEERQLCMGLRYLIDPACSDVCFALIHGTTATSKKVDAIRAMVTVFRDLFVEGRVHAVLFGDLPEVRRYSFDETCYMWWDFFPRHGVPTSEELRPIDLAILEDLREILAVESFACKQSALRGLGMWSASYQAEVASIVDSEAHIPHELVRLAHAARSGRVQ